MWWTSGFPEKRRCCDESFHRGKPGSGTGQAAVELLAILPLVGLAAAIVFHLAIAGWSLWSAAEAARAAARAAAVDSDPRQVALTALPTAFRKRASVRLDSGRVEVGVAIPTLVPGISLPRVKVEAGPLEPDA